MTAIVYLNVIPPCDFCGDEEKYIVPEVAYVDARTMYGGWAYMCRQHWHVHGGTNGVLGTGRGQLLILKPVDDGADVVHESKVDEGLERGT